MMYLTNEKIESLRQERAKAEAAAEETYMKEIFPSEKKMLAEFINTYIVCVLLQRFDDNCGRAKKEGYYEPPKVKIQVIQDGKGRWSMSFSSKKSENDAVEYNFCYEKAYNSAKIKELIQAASEEVRTKMIPGEINGPDMFTASIEIDF